MRVALAAALLASVAVGCGEEPAPVIPAPEVADIRTRGMICGVIGKTPILTFAPGQFDRTLEGQTTPTDEMSQRLPPVSTWMPGPGSPILYANSVWQTRIDHSDGELRLGISEGEGSGSKSFSVPCTIDGDPPAPGTERVGVLN
jgi:hypothetical protein